MGKRILAIILTSAFLFSFPGISNAAPTAQFTKCSVEITPVETNNLNVKFTSEWKVADGVPDQYRALVYMTVSGKNLTKSTTSLGYLLNGTSHSLPKLVVMDTMGKLLLS